MTINQIHKPATGNPVAILCRYCVKTGSPVARHSAGTLLVTGATFSPGGDDWDTRSATGQT